VLQPIAVNSFLSRDKRDLPWSFNRVEELFRDKRDLPWSFNRVETCSSWCDEL
jgi:hypothetical protein